MAQVSGVEPLFRSNCVAFFWRCAICLLVAGTLLALPQVRAERLPVRQYTVADGLAHGTVSAIHQDAKGFLWLATGDGLSRFDGYRFTNYGRSDGLINAQITDVVTDRRGRLWVATNGGGVALMLDDVEAARRGTKFLHFLIRPLANTEYSNSVSRILFDADNRMWCGTEWGFYRARSPEVASEQFELVDWEGRGIRLLFLDQRQRIWACWDHELLRIEGSRHIVYRLGQEAGSSSNLPNLRFLKGTIQLPDGHLLAATAKDLYEFIEPASADERGRWRRLPLRLASLQTIQAIYPAEDGGLWLGTDLGLIHYRDGQQVPYRIGNTPNFFIFRRFLTDRDGNLWIGTRQTGLLKVTGTAVAVYDARDGLKSVLDVHWLGETNDGRMMLRGRPFSLANCDETFFATGAFDRTRALERMPAPAGVCVHGVAQDNHQNWWVLHWVAPKKTYRVRFIPGPQYNPSAGYELTAADGWLDNCCYAGMHKDGDGNLWFRNDAKQVFRVEYTNTGRPALRLHVNGIYGSHMLRDPYGNLWFSNAGEVLRYKGGKTEKVRMSGDAGGQRVTSFFADRNGRVWYGTEGQGVFMCEKPDADPPTFVNYNKTDGLSADYVEGICEGDDGRIWLGTGHGLDWLDVTTDRVGHFSFGENSIGSVVRDLHKDRYGNLWVSVLGAVIRINPRLLPRPSAPPPVSFVRIRIAGELLPLAETGATDVTAPELAASQNNVAVEFLSPNFRGENALQYQFKLVSADADWSAPSPQREVNYANLSPGQYRFQVRVVDGAGVVGAEPASLRFTILRPVWQRWWFVIIALLGIGLTAFAFYRSRIKRVVELERVRTRIATDLHDDIGASLSQIAILSEVSRQRIGLESKGVGESLAQIAATSRDLVDSMSDIVWATNPRRDRLSDLTQRMREFAGDVFTAREIEFSFRAPADGREIHLDAELRRQIYLIFKEAVNNAARHARCTEAGIEFEVAEERILLTVRDNGRGFDSATVRDGNGLKSMRERARALGGDVEILSQPVGTTIEFCLPLRQRQRPKWRRYLPV